MESVCVEEGANVSEGKIFVEVSVKASGANVSENKVFVGVGYNISWLQDRRAKLSNVKKNERVFLTGMWAASDAYKIILCSVAPTGI